MLVLNMLYLYSYIHYIYTHTLHSLYIFFNLEKLSFLIILNIKKISYRNILALNINNSFF